jgi:hypothetical protein
LTNAVGDKNRTSNAASRSEPKIGHRWVNNHRMVTKVWKRRTIFSLRGKNCAWGNSFNTRSNAITTNIKVRIPPRV